MRFVGTGMMFDRVSAWARWLAQDADGTWPRGAGRGCKAAEAATAALRAYEAEPGQQHHGRYANEVGRIVRLGQTAPPDDWETTLTAWPRRPD